MRILSIAGGGRSSPAFPLTLANAVEGTHKKKSPAEGDPIQHRLHVYG